MKQIRQANEIIGMLERGDLNADLSNEIQRVLKELIDGAPPKGKLKGSVQVKLSFTVDSGSVEIEAAIESKLPKRARSRDFYFVTPEGGLSTEHPRQQDMFAAPREVRAAE